ncbi:hypothetical protein AWZ03_006843 [Drosophila navojoa]|uniref:Odorant receptor n=1 Tax=Drosophila navojoa TaxID=7232 RepID=A0A484BD70_DRONA|nr:hypothetical protein AWZ03_006843 [Drosophila navojoa]
MTAEPISRFTFNDFMSLSVVLYNSLGIHPYDLATRTGLSTRWLLTIFLFQVVNLNFVLGLECAFVYISFKNNDNFVESCMVMGYIVFVIVGELKMVTVWLRRDQLNDLMIEMERIFPSTDAESQRQYQVERYLRRGRMFTKGFAGLYLLLIATYNLFVIIQFLVKRYVQEVPGASMAMPYTSVSPWGVHNIWGFCLMYLLQSLAGYTCTAGHASSDILIFAVLIQTIMHYDYLSRRLTELLIQAGRVKDGYQKDLKVLQQLIAYHNQLLGLTEVINRVFGLPLLLNFMSSSLMVCFVGFQMTIGLSLDVVCKLAVLLVAEMAEIYLICYFSDELVNASFSVSDAVYNMNWPDADKRFNKMLIIVAQRAQRPVCLRATVFLDVSMPTMTMVWESQGVLIASNID